MTTRNLNFNDDFEASLADLAAQVRARQNGITADLAAQKRRREDLALGASAVIQQSLDETDSLNEEQDQIDAIVLRADNLVAGFGDPVQPPAAPPPADNDNGNGGNNPPAGAPPRGHSRNTNPFNRVNWGWLSWVLAGGFAIIGFVVFCNTADDVWDLFHDSVFGTAGACLAEIGWFLLMTVGVFFIGGALGTIGRSTEDDNDDHAEDAPANGHGNNPA